MNNICESTFSGSKSASAFQIRIGFEDLDNKGQSPMDLDLVRIWFEHGSNVYWVYSLRQ